MPLQHLSLPKRKVQTSTKKFSDQPSPLELEPLAGECEHFFLVPRPKGDWVVGKCMDCSGEKVFAAHFGSAQAVSNVSEAENRLSSDQADSIMASLSMQIDSESERVKFRIDHETLLRKSEPVESKKRASKGTARNRKPKRRFEIVKPKNAGKLQLPVLKRI